MLQRDFMKRRMRMKKVNHILIGKGMDRVIPYAPWQPHKEAIGFRGQKHPEVVGHGMRGRGPPPPPPPPKPPVSPPVVPPGGSMVPPVPQPPPAAVPPSTPNRPNPAPSNPEPSNSGQSSQRTNELIGAIAGSLTGTVVLVIAVKRLIALIPARTVTDAKAAVLETLMSLASDEGVRALAEEGLADRSVMQALEGAFEEHAAHAAFERGNRAGSKSFIGAVGSLSGDIIQQVASKIREEGGRIIQIKDELSAQLFQIADQVRQLPEQARNAVSEEVARKGGEIEDIGRDILADANAALENLGVLEAPKGPPGPSSSGAIAAASSAFRGLPPAQQLLYLEQLSEYDFSEKGVPEEIRVTNDGLVRVKFPDTSIVKFNMVQDGFGGMKFDLAV